jgi:hypothetical protein
MPNTPVYDPILGSLAKNETDFFILQTISLGQTFCCDKDNQSKGVKEVKYNYILCYIIT